MSCHRLLSRPRHGAAPGSFRWPAHLVLYTILGRSSTIEPRSIRQLCKIRLLALTTEVLRCYGRDHVMQAIPTCLPQVSRGGIMLHPGLYNDTGTNRPIACFILAASPRPFSSCFMHIVTLLHVKIYKATTSLCRCTWVRFARFLFYRSTDAQHPRQGAQWSLQPKLAVFQSSKSISAIQLLSIKVISPSRKQSCVQICARWPQHKVQRSRRLEQQGEGEVRQEAAA